MGKEITKKTQGRGQWQQRAFTSERSLKLKLRRRGTKIFETRISFLWKEIGNIGSRFKGGGNQWGTGTKKKVMIGRENPPKPEKKSSLLI